MGWQPGARPRPSEVDEDLCWRREEPEEAGAELLTVYRDPRSQWKSLRSTNGLERLNLEFRRRVKTQGSLPSEDAVLALLFGLVATGQIVFRKLDGWPDMAIALTSAAPHAEEAA